MFCFRLRCLLWLWSALMCCSCANYRPKTAFDPAQVPKPPDYADLNNWAAHPAKKDLADRTPGSLANAQDNAGVDVFFLYPTSLTGSKRSHERWNGDVFDQELNEATDKSSILFQASIFNGAGRVFAPRYRQAHLTAFYGKDKASAAKALEVAYSDVLSAFDHYLRYHNQGRPFILAAHSQGALHGKNLVRDRIEQTDLKKQLVAAYLAGYPIDKTFFKTLSPCETPEQTGCYCTWRTWERRYGRRHAKEDDVVCTNPLVWNTQPGLYTAKTANKGGVVTPFEKILPGLADAEVCHGILLCSKPKFPGSFLFVRKNYHIGDLNLYYMNVRENAALRAETFLKR
jgi:Protein of unknown function (DUF3089)